MTPTFLVGLLVLSGVLGTTFWVFARQPAADTAGAPEGTPHAKTKRAFGLGLFLLVSAGVYGIFGQPDYIQPRLFAADEAGIGAQLRPAGINTLEAYGALIASGTASKDEWLDMAEALRASGRMVEAADALQRAANLTEDTGEHVALLGAAGEMFVQANGGRVDSQAQEAFNTVLQADPDSLGALFFLGRKARSDGDIGLARRHWARFLSLAGDDHPMVASVRNDLVLLDAPSPENALAPALTAEMRAQFADLSDEERQVQIFSMLQRVDNRLAELGAAASAEEWRDLARAYQRVGKYTEALRAYDNAITRAPDSEALIIERSQIAQSTAPTPR